MTDAERYQKSFGVPANRQKAALALEHALDTRKFEIELYWKKATYFWALIAVSFAGYFAVLGSEHIADKDYLAYIIGCVGCVFSLAWFLVNKGSKFWQENWENHVDMLEDETTGPLFKTVLHRPVIKDPFERYITGPAKFSAGKTNQWVGLFTVGIWVALIIHTLPEFSASGSVSLRHIAIGALAVGASILMCVRGESHMGAQDYQMHSRRAQIL